jgi:hypothetical protein
VGEANWEQTVEQSSHVAKGRDRHLVASLTLSLRILDAALLNASSGPDRSSDVMLSYPTIAMFLGVIA